MTKAGVWVRWQLLLLAVVMAALLVLFCGGDSAILRVGHGQTFKTISEAAALAKSGDTILVAPGVYAEAVLLDTADVSLKPLGKGDVWVDGGCERENGIRISASSAGVRQIGVRNTSGAEVFIDSMATNVSVRETAIQDYNCAENPDQSAAGSAGPLSRGYRTRIAGTSTGRLPVGVL